MIIAWRVSFMILGCLEDELASDGGDFFRLGNNYDD